MFGNTSFRKYTRIEKGNPFHDTTTIFPVHKPEEKDQPEVKNALVEDIVASSPSLPHNSVSGDAISLPGSIEVEHSRFTLEDPEEARVKINPEPEPTPLPRCLTIFYPPKGNSVTSHLPGFWAPPGGHGSKITGIDSFYWSFWWFVRTQPVTFAKCGLIILAQGVVAFLTPLKISDLFENNIEDTSRRRFISELAILAVLFYLAGFLDYLKGRWNPAGVEFQPVTVARLVEHMLSLPIEVSDKIAPGYALATMQHVQSLDSNITALLEIFSSTMVLGATLFAFSTFDLSLIALQIVCVVLTGAAMVKTSSAISSASDSFESAQTAFMNNMEEILERRPSIILLRLGGYVNNRIRDVARDFTVAFDKLDKVTNENALLLSILSESSGVLSIALGGLLVQFGVLNISQLFVFYAANRSLFSVIKALVDSLKKMQLSAAHLRAIVKNVDLHARHFPESHNPQLHGRVEFRNVHFSYSPNLPNGSQGSGELIKKEDLDGEVKPSVPPSLASDLPDQDVDRERSEEQSLHDEEWSENNQHLSREVLWGFNLTIPAGAKVAVVGRSGAGKSSFLKLLVRGYLPDEGAILIGGEYLNSLDVPKTVAICEQSAQLFNTTILENIRVGTNATDAECEQAAKQACVIGTPDALWSLPLGLDTPCGAGGKHLSLGQCQRVLVARAFVRRTPLVLLDEPLSGQDQQTKHSMMQHMLNLTYETKLGGSVAEWPSTVVVVTHLMERIEDWDYVAFIDGGTLADFGPCKKLMEQQGPFWRFRFRASLVSINESGLPTINDQGIRRNTLLAHMEDKDVQALQSHFVLRKCKPGEIIHTQGEPGEAFFFVVEGVVNEFFRNDWDVPEAAGQMQPKKAGGGIGKFRAKAGNLTNRRFKENGLRSRLGQASDRAISRYGEVIRELVTGDYTNEAVLYWTHLYGGEATQGNKKQCLNQFTAMAKSECVLVLISRPIFSDILDERPQLKHDILASARRIQSLCFNTLRRCWQLAAIPDSQVERLASHMQPESLQNSDRFYSRDAQDSPCMYMVLSGRVLLSMETREGVEAGNQVLQTGESFGLDRLCGSEMTAKEVVRSAISVGEATVMQVNSALFSCFGFDLHPTIHSVLSFRTEDHLSKLWPFSRIPSDVLHRLGQALEPAVYPQSWPLIGTQQTVLDGFIIVFGSLDLTVKTLDGNFMSFNIGPGRIVNLAHMLHSNHPPYEVVSLTCLERAVVLRVPQGVLWGMLPEDEEKETETPSHFGPLSSMVSLVATWESTCDPSYITNRLQASDVEGSVMSALAALNVHTVSHSRSLLLSEADNFHHTPLLGPMAVLVLQGGLEFSTGDNKVTRVGPKDVLVNAEGMSHLRRKCGGSGILGQEVQFEVLQFEEFSKVIATELSIVAFLDFTQVEKCILESSTLQRKISHEEEERQVLVHQARSMQQQVADGERRLGWRAGYKGPTHAWRRIIRIVVARLTTAWALGAHTESGTIITSAWDPSSVPYMAHFIRQQLEDEILKFSDQISTVQSQVAKQTERLEALKEEWMEVGLTRIMELPQGTADLAESRLDEIERLITIRVRSLKQDRARCRRDLDTLRAELEVSEEEWEGIASQLDSLRGRAQLCAMEEQVRQFQWRMRPMVAALNTELDDLQSELGVPSSEWTRLREDQWSLEQWIQAKSQAATLKAVLSGSRVSRHQISTSAKELQDKVDNLTAENHRLSALVQALEDECAEREGMADQILELENENTSMLLELNDLHMDKDKEVLELRGQLAQAQEEIEEEKLESAALREQLIKLRVSTLNIRTRDEDFQTLTDEVLLGKVPGSSGQVGEEIEQMCTELGVTPDFLEGVTLPVPEIPTDTEDRDAEAVALDRRQRLMVIYLREQVKLRMILDEHSKMQLAFLEADTSETDRSKALAPLVLTNPMDTQAVVSQLTSVRMQTEAELEEPRLTREKHLETMQSLFTRMARIDLFEDIQEFAMRSAGPKRMANVKRKLQQTEAWMKIFDMDAKISKINERLKREMNEAEGNSYRRQEIKSKAAEIRDGVIKNQSLLEDEFGRLPGTKRPENPKFYRNRLSIHRSPSPGLSSSMGGSVSERQKRTSTLFSTTSTSILQAQTVINNFSTSSPTRGKSDVKNFTRAQTPLD